MELSQFLARTVAPGGYIAISVNADPVERKKKWFTRMFADGQHAEAAGFISWADRKGWEVYHAQGAYKAAEVEEKDGRTQFRGSKEQDNVGALRSFWIDLDCKRDGDKKDPSTVFADRVAALAWLKQFCSVVGMPLPNQMVDSGYGFHCYWLLEDPLLKHNWQPYADAMKAAMLKHGFIGDSGLTSDCARVLRPISTHNRKSGTPVLVKLISKLTRGELPNQIILAALQPYVGQVALSQAMGARAGALTGGTVSPIFAASSQPLPNMAKAAMQTVQDARPRFFQRIVQECAQARQSLANHGNGDQYPLWYLGFLSLLTFVDDADTYVHAMSDGDPRYTAAETDAAWLRAKHERATKGLGAPTCQHFERARPGVCATCPHWGKIISPVSVGIKDGDLPNRYRRDAGMVQVSVFDAVAKEWVWKEVFTGDIHSPLLDKIEGGYQLLSTYERAGNRYPVAVTSNGLVDDTGRVAAALSQQYLTITRAQTARATDFFMAWINKLRDMRAERAEKIQPFGWAMSPDNAIVGFAVAGTLYRNNGGKPPRVTLESAPGGDAKIIEMYAPMGTLAAWQHVAQFVTAGRPDLQVIVAAAFAAPLMRFTGQKGVALSVWSRQSAVGKSSAIEVARAVWGASGAKNTLLDTSASVIRKLAETRVMPCFWDEMRVGDDRTAQTVDMIFNITEGKEKSRLNADAQLKKVAEWETLVLMASNQSLMDLVVKSTSGTDAGALRVFEFEISQPASSQNAQAPTIVALVNDNYGRAGEVYATYLAAQHETIKLAVEKQMAKISAELGAATSERFFVAAITALLVGAKIAHAQGIIQFDMAGLKAVLVKAFKDLRGYRSNSLLVGPSGLDYEQIFSTFMNEHNHEKLITDRFARQGHAAGIVFQPSNVKSINVQVSINDDAMRISRKAINDWCRKNGIPGRSFIEAMEQNWGAIQVRSVIAGGTVYGSGAVWVVEISLQNGGTQGYRYIDPNIKPAKATP